MIQTQFIESDFKDAMSNLAHGVSILSVKDEGLIYGLTINSFNSVSLNPTLVLFSIEKKTKNLEKYLNCESFTVSVLSEKQRNISDYFAQSINRDQDVIQSWFTNDHHCFVKDALSFFFCKIKNKIDAGSSYVILGEVQNVKALNSNEKPLLYLKRNYFSLGEKIDE